jgi:virginiamycin B lyase
MNSDLTCRRCRDALLEFTAGTLSAADRQAVERHLASCAECRRERDAWLALGGAIRERGQRVPADDGFASGLVRLRAALALETVESANGFLPLAGENLSDLSVEPVERDPRGSDRRAATTTADPDRLVTLGATRRRPYEAIAATLAIILIAALVFGSLAARLRAGPGDTGLATPTTATTPTTVPTATPISVGPFTEFTIPTWNGTSCGLGAITSGPDGALWFTECAKNQIGRITTDGKVTEFPIPTANGKPLGITSGPDGALWFTESDLIGRITTSGSFNEFPLPPLPGAQSVPRDIISGPDGALWFTVSGVHSIGRITTWGSISMFPIYFHSFEGLARGPDGALWSTELNGEKIYVARITTGGGLTEFTVPGDAQSQPVNIAAGLIASGPDDALWFTRPNGYIGRITTGGAVTAFPLPTGLPVGITGGPDGALWFTADPNLIGRIAP